MAKAERYCYLDPPFPDTALMGVAFVNIDGSRVLTLCSRLCQSNQELITRVTEFAKAIKKKGTFLESVVIYRVAKKALVPLDKKLWTKCPGKLNAQEATHDFWYRQRQLIKWMETPLLMQMLVAPQTYKSEKDQWCFMPIAPFYISGNDELIHGFMQNSNAFVDPRAQSAAMYVPVKVASIHWPTKIWQKINLKKDLSKRIEVN